MVANLLNAILGIWLVYVAVFDRAWAGANQWRLPLAAVRVLVLAFWAHTSDYRKWQSSVNLVLGVLLLILAGLHWNGAAPPLLMFWGVFWLGILVAMFALWAALYRPVSDVQEGPVAGGSAARR
ncbi:MAG TPA: hypothetical protein VNE59_06105 [Burkholderiales bacterium]|nr:hypothetical protein [Burkholderiales bacterium]